MAVGDMMPPDAGAVAPPPPDAPPSGAPVPMLGNAPPPAQLQPPGPPPGPSPVTIDDVMDLLRNNSLRGFRIDVETDQLVEADENADKAHRMEFVQAVGGLMQGALQAMGTPAGPIIGPAIAETIMFAVRGFKAGASLEDAFETALEKLTNMPPPQQQGQGPDPKVAVQMKALEQKDQQHADNMAMREKEIATNAQIKNESLAQNAEIKNQALAQEAALEKLKIEHEAALQGRDHAHAQHLNEQQRKHEAAMEAMRAHVEALKQAQQAQLQPQMPQGVVVSPQGPQGP